MDRPGKDSYRIRDAGAGEVFLIGDKRSALLREYHEQPEPSLAEAVAQLSPCDLVLVEGFKYSSAPKIEVFRPSLGKAPLWPHESLIVAVASEVAVDCDLPLFHLDDVAGIAQFISSTVVIKA